MTDLLIPLVNAIAASRHLASYEEHLKLQAKDAQTKIQFINTLLRDVLEGQLMPKSEVFVERLSAFNPSLFSHPDPREQWKASWRFAAAFTEQEWKEWKEKQVFAKPGEWNSWEVPSPFFSGKPIKVFQGSQEFLDAPPEQLLALSRLQYLSRSQAGFPPSLLYLALKTSTDTPVPLTVARDLGLYTEVIAQMEQEVRTSLRQTVRDAQLYELWEREHKDYWQEKHVPDRATYQWIIDEDFFLHTLDYLAWLPFDGLASLTQEYDGCQLIGLPQNTLPTLIDYLRAYSAHSGKTPMRDYRFSEYTGCRYVEKEQILAVKPQLLGLLTRYGAAVFVAYALYDDAYRRIFNLTTASGYNGFNDPEPQITGVKSQIDVLRSINRLTLDIARKLASEEGFNTPVNETTVKRHLPPAPSETQIKAAIESEQFRRNQIRTLLASEQIDRLAILQRELTAADADIRACVQPFLDADPLIAAYLITRANFLAGGRYYADWYYPQPHLPDTPPSAIADTVAKLVTIFASRQGLGKLLQDWTEQELRSTLVHLPLTEAERQQVYETVLSQLPAKTQNTLRTLSKLQELCILLTKEENRLPLLVPAEYETQPERPLTYAEMTQKIANDLTNLPKFTARVRIATEAGLVEHTVKTLDPNQQPERPLFGQALQARRDRIRDRNIQNGYLRERTVVEAEIRKRHGRWRKPPTDEPPAISRREPLS